MQRIVILFALIGFVAPFEAARAQFWDDRWMGGYHASTPFEGYARGMADMTRSAGMANLLDAQAAGAFEQARTQAIQNDVLATEAYFNRKAINRANREANRRPALTTDRLASLSRSRLPGPLSVSDFDPVSGEIAWPAVLREPTYQSYRTQLDTLFAARAMAGGDLTIQQATAIQNLTTEMTNTLRNNIRNYPSSAYMQARNFVDSLSFEGRL